MEIRPMVIASATCGNCGYCVEHEDNALTGQKKSEMPPVFTCHRYPNQVQVLPSDCCGEFKSKWKYKVGDFYEAYSK
jgi:hypothetical protein